MIELAGYRINAQLYRGSNAVVYRGIRERDERPVILKQLNRKYPTTGELAQFRREYDIMHAFDSDAVVRVFGMETYRNTLVMVEEDFGGKSIDRFLPFRKFDPQAFLRLAIRIASALSVIHQCNIIHKDIHPGNIVWNPETEALKITDFGIAAPFGREKSDAIPPGELEGTLAYISPEQTGRMKIPVDYRTDYYSLGVTLYQIATGRLPFESDDPASLVHSHIARQPEPPGERDPMISPVLSAIILKCMAKAAEERYQSLFGLVADLQECLDRFRSGKPIASLILGAHDISRALRIPRVLYGRDDQVEQIVDHYQRVRQGAKEMLLVAGNPGIGKTALVEELQKAVARESAWFISGKFNRLEQRTPYSALVQAFRGLVQQVTSGGEEAIAFWKKAILKALGGNAQLLVELIPDLGLITGDLETPPGLPPAEAQNRFNLTFLGFIRAFSRNGPVLILVLDDLQWADEASLNLMERVMEDAETERLLIVGTYRDMEVDESHRLRAIVTHLRQSDISVTTRDLKPLTLSDVNRFLSDALSSPPGDTAPLAEICFLKTRGNPLFLVQLLQSLYRDGHVFFDSGRGEWSWDINEIRQAGITDDIVDLMVRRIDRLSEETKNVLLAASVIGTHFDAATVSLVTGMSADETARHLDLAVEESLLIRTRHGCRFPHDRIQQAAYGLLPSEKRQALHLEIGRQLHRHTPPDGLDEAVFRIVNQLNAAVDLIREPGERRLLAQLNLLAGKKAKASAAFESACNYLEAGIGLLPKHRWRDAYELTRDLYTEAAEAAFCCTNFERMDRLADAVIASARTLQEKVNCYDLKIQWYFARNELPKVVGEGLRLLNRLGHRFPENPKTAYLAAKLLGTKAALARLKTDDLKQLEDMRHPEALSAIRIMRNLAHAAYGARPNLNPILGFASIRLSLKYGVAPETPTGFAGYAMVLCGVLGDIENGARYGELALHLSGRECAKRFRAQTAFLVAGMVDHWKKPLRETLQPLFAAYQLGLELGDLEFATLSLFFHDAHSWFTGARLNELSQEMAAHSRTIARFKQETHFNFTEMARQVVLNLTGRADAPCRLRGEAYDEEQMLPLHMKNNDMSAVFMVWFYRMLLSYLFEDHAEALACSAKAAPHLRSMVSTAWVPLFYVYDSLIRLAVVGDEDRRTRKRHLKRVSANQRKLGKWAACAPVNYRHKWTLVEAERLRVAGNIVDAMAHYDRAILDAGKHQFLQEEALANELAAKFWLAANKLGFAEHYMAKALHLYTIWGAAAKVDHLSGKYPLLLPDADAQSRGKSPGTTTASALSAVLDLDAVLKALQALSGEIVFDELMRKMMTVVIENAGAQKAQLLFPDEGGWVIEAEGAVVKNTISIRTEASTALPLTAPLSVLHLAALKRQTVGVNDAVEDTRFGGDPYFQQHRPRSVLCVPIFHRANLTGLLYLENRLIPGAFTADRLELVNILASQTATSIENARLYARLKASETKYRSIFENAAEGIFQVSADGRFISANPALARIVGFDSPQEMMASSAPRVIERVCDADTRVRIIRTLRSNGQVIDFESAGVRRDNTEFWGALSVRAVYGEGGDLLLYEGSLVDITERKIREKAEQETREARATARAKSEFLANMSHEIRTPMTAIMGLADILLKSGLTEKQRANLQQIKGTSHSLMRIIDDILDFSKIEAGKLTFDSVGFRLSDILNKIACLFAGVQAEKDVEMLVSVSPETPERLLGDPLRVEQVLINLVSNAFKFTHRGTVLIGVQPVQWAGNRVQLQFYVEDTGIGIPQNAMNSLFEAFTQADGTIGRKYGGTGLGLTISKKLVEMMQGRIWVERNDNPGSTFYFTIALGCLEDENRPPLSLPVSAAAKSVLVVDDNHVSRRLLARQITALGPKVVTCPSGEQAVEMAGHPAGGKGYDLILMDAKMPGLCGIEAAGHIRAGLGSAAPPIIIMDGRFESDVLNPEVPGIRSLLSKPILPEPLYDALLAVFSNEVKKSGAPAEELKVPPGVLQRLRGSDLLLVEDNPINRMILVELMESVGVHVDLCENGRQAIAAVMRKHYDAVLMDIQMPDMDGYETTRLIRRINGLGGLPIIAVSAHAFEEHKQECLAAGMNDFISKPIDLRDMLVKLAANIPAAPADEALN